MKLSQDIRYAFRRLIRDWKFTLTVTAILALCIGANSAMFSVFNSILLKPLPYPGSERLMQVVTYLQTEGGEALRESQNGLVWEAVRDQTPSLDSAVYSGWTSGVNFVQDGVGQYVNQQRVGAGFFRVLGVAPLLGREFTPEEDRPEGPAAVVLSHGLWQQAFGSDPAIVGRSVLLRGAPHTVVGVMPPQFRTSADADLWTPLRPSTSGEGGGTNYGIMARLQSGVSLSRAKAEVEALSPGLIERRALPVDPPATLSLLPLQRAATNHLDDPLLLLAAASLALLLLGCINISGMLLARSAGRSSEMATRIALGAARSRIISQLLVENVLLALAGGAAAVATGLAMLRGMQLLAGGIYPQLLAVTVEWKVIGATFALACVCGLIFGVAPALQVSRANPGTSGGMSRSVAGRRRLVPLGMLAGGQVALMIPLLLGAGLMVRTFQHLWDLDPGFEPSRVTAARFSLQDARYENSRQVQQLFDRGLNALRTEPGIEAAAVTLSLPYERGLNMPFTLPGREGFDRAITNMAYVSADFFDVLRIPLLQGRLFDRREESGTASVVVNDAFAQRYFSSEPALGETLRVSSTDYTVVGIVSSVQQRPGWGDFGPLAPVPTIYVTVPSLSEGFLPVVHTWFAPSWIVRSTLAASETAAALRRATSAADPMLPVASVVSLNETKAGSLSSQRMMAILLAILASLAMLLAALGIYGLTTNMVAERWRELGIRQALGSTRVGMVSEVVVRTLKWVGVGAVAGCLLALTLEQLLASFIWGVSATDPVTLAAVAAGFVVLTAVASLLPAMHVIRLDPAQVLRSE